MLRPEPWRLLFPIDAALGVAIPVMTRGEGPPGGAAGRPGPPHRHRLAAVLLTAAALAFTGAIVAWFAARLRLRAR